ncbi:MAG: hypothetical protein J07HX64_02165 [halophilic archaeon J07HX64]|nr:MAG: hypothetical protein J07HX64_02165 [halophilic archaeon J07HX64]
MYSEQALRTAIATTQAVATHTTASHIST